MIYGDTIMQSKHISILALLVAIALFTPVASARPYTLLHSFSGADGGAPTGLFQTADGTFYGAAVLGGDVNTCDPDGCGTLLKTDSAGHFTGTDNVKDVYIKNTHDCQNYAFSDGGFHASPAIACYLELFASMRFVTRTNLAAAFRRPDH